MTRAHAPFKASCSGDLAAISPATRLTSASIRLSPVVRHGCGYALANAGHDTRAIQDWLGHRSIQHTVRYTELSPTRFKDFWRD
jgi:site-specific recombinase XerD